VIKHLIDKRFVRLSLAAVAIATLSACANWGKPLTPEQRVNARSDALFDLRMSNKFKESYAYTSPGYRAVNGYDKFRLKYAVVSPLSGGKVTSISCEEERCTVRRAYTTTTALMPNAEIPIGIDETWIYQQGEWWWHVQ
jgi:hypothetical protein